MSSPAVAPGRLALAATILLSSSLPVMGGALIAPALPALRAHFQDVAGADTLVRLVLTTPGLAVALTAPLAGAVIGRLGRRRALLWGLALYALAGTTGLYVDALGPMLVGRAALGVSMALVMTCATTLLADHYAGPQRARFMAMQSASMALGGVAFLIGGGVLADLHWRAPFGVYASSLVVALLAWWALAKQPQGAAMAPSAQAQTPAPAGAIAAAALAAMMVMALFYLIPVQVPFIVKERLRAGATEAGVAVALSTLVSAASSMLAPRTIRRLGHPGTLLVTFSLVSPGLALIGLAQGWPLLLAGLALVGAGGGHLMPNVNAWVSQLAPEAARPLWLGRLTAAIFLGQFISPVMASPFLMAGWGQRGVFLGGAGVSAALLLLYAALRGRLDAATRGQQVG